MSARIHRKTRHLARDRARQWIEQREGVDRIVEQLHAHRFALGFRREDVDDVAADTVGALCQIELVAGVLHLRQAPQQLALVDSITAHQVQDHRQIGLWIAEAVDRGNRGDNDGVRTLEQRLGCREPHLLDVLVYRGVLLDKGIRGWDVRLRLVVVVVGDEVLHRIMWKELAELAVELGGEGFVVGEDHRGALYALDDTRN